MKKPLVYKIVILISIIIIYQLLNPLRRPVEIIKKSLLEEMPLGTDEEDIYKYIENHKKLNISEGSAYDGSNPKEFVKGIRVHMGSYLFGEGIFTVDVVAFFRLDINSKLIDITIKKYSDSI